MKNYNKLKKVIQLVNPGIVINKNAQLIKFNGEVEYFEQCRPIRLADILLTLFIEYPKQKTEKWEISKAYEDLLINPYYRWNLKDDNLDNQRKEIKKFLIDLLV